LIGTNPGQFLFRHFPINASRITIPPTMKSVFSLWLLLMASINAQVQVESLPEPGIQPQVVVTTAGVVHLVYLKGDPKACDIRHATRRVEGDEWTAPVTVNSEPRSAIAAGTIRGAQIALGKDGSVQVIWNGSSDTKPGKMPQSPLLHARLQPGAKAFSPQQNLMGDTTALDGGASIAANDKGHVCAATTPDARGMTLITSKAGRTALTKLDDWRIAACPMSSASLLPSAQSLRAAWENDGQIVTGLMGAAAAATQKIGPKNAKHPTLTQNARGQTLITSIIGSGWSKAGSLHWDILDAQGRVTDSGDGEKLPVWSYATAYARPDGGFVILR
jgi:hypothetical protein